MTTRMGSKIILKIFSFAYRLSIRVLCVVQSRQFIIQARLQGAVVHDSLIVRGVPFFVNKGGCQIDENVIINSSLNSNPVGGQTRTIIVIKSGAELHINNGARISNSTFYVSKRINIGENAYIGANCQIYDTDFHSIILENRIKIPDPDVKSSEVIISDGAFIGAHAIVLKGVTIGENSVIGAGSIVTKDIPSDEVWAGNPAKFVKKLNNVQNFDV